MKSTGGLWVELNKMIGCLLFQIVGVQHWANVSQKSSNLGEFVSFADLTSVSGRKSLLTFHFEYI